jgi:hypothetical protein
VRRRPNLTRGRLSELPCSYLALYFFGLSREFAGATTASSAAYEESIALARGTGDSWLLSIPLWRLAWRAMEDHNHGAARERWQAIRELQTEGGDRTLLIYALNGLAYVAELQGNAAEATALIAESLALARGFGARAPAAYALEGLAHVLVLRDRLLPAARLLAAAAALVEPGAPRPPAEQAFHARTAAAVRVALGADGHAAAWAAGRALSLDDALDDAAAQIASSTAAQGHVSPPA